MITIFHGRKLSLDGTQDEIYAQVSVAIRDKLHFFNTGKTLNPFGIFMCISLHSDINGWAYPSRDRIKESTGISTDDAITASLKHLRSMRIEGHKVFEMYREYDPKLKVWGKTCYRIFPGAFTDGLASAPSKFTNLRIYECKTDLIHDDPVLGDPVVDNPVDNKDSQIKNNHLPAQKKRDHHL